MDSSQICIPITAPNWLCDLASCFIFLILTFIIYNMKNTKSTLTVERTREREYEMQSRSWEIITIFLQGILMSTCTWGRARSQHTELDSLPASYMKLKLAYTALLLLGSCNGTRIPPVAAHGSHWVIQPVKWLGCVTEIMALKWSLSPAACGLEGLNYWRHLWERGVWQFRTCVGFEEGCEKT